MRHVDQVVAADGAMASRLEKLGAVDVTVCPHWLETPHDGSELPPSLARIIRRVRQRYQRVVLHLGEYSDQHDLRSILDFIRKNPYQREFFFLFIGGGNRWQSLEDFYQRYHPACMYLRHSSDVDEELSLASQADFGLVTMRHDCAGTTTDNGFAQYLRAGKPLIYLGPLLTAPAAAIEQYDCGRRIPVHLPDVFESLLQRMALPVFPYEALAAAATCAFDENYDATTGTEQFLQRCFGVAEAKTGTQAETTPTLSAPVKRPAADRAIGS